MYAMSASVMAVESKMAASTPSFSSAKELIESYAIGMSIAIPNSDFTSNLT